MPKLKKSLRIPHRWVEISNLQESKDLIKELKKEFIFRWVIIKNGVLIKIVKKSQEDFFFDLYKALFKLNLSAVYIKIKHSIDSKIYKKDEDRVKK